VKLACFILLLAASASAQDPLRDAPPRDVQDFFRTAAEALADRDSAAFLGHFDRGMPGFGQLRGDVEALAATDVSSTLEIAKDEGNGQARVVELDWMIRIDQARPRREIVRCRIEKQGKKWKITSFEPLRFFEK
jgi:hypothetical protein